MNEVISRAITIVGSQTKLARLTGVSQAAVSKWLKNKMKVKESRVPLIVEATKGKIKACEIRPDLPHLFPAQKE